MVEVGFRASSVVKDLPPCVAVRCECLSVRVHFQTASVGDDELVELGVYVRVGSPCGGQFFLVAHDFGWSDG